MRLTYELTLQQMQRCTAHFTPDNKARSQIQNSLKQTQKQPTAKSKCPSIQQIGRQIADEFCFRKWVKIQMSSEVDRPIDVVVLGYCAKMIEFVALEDLEPAWRIEQFWRIEFFWSLYKA